MPPRDFYIQPANVDIKPVLQGIGALTAGARQAQVKQQKQKQLADVMATNDPEQIADFMIKNPESQAQIKGGMQFRNAATERDYGNFLAGFLANPTRDNFVDMAEARSKFVRDQGGDSSGIDQAIALYDEDPEAAIQKAETALSLFDPKKFKSFQSAKGGGEGAIKREANQIKRESLELRRLEAALRREDNELKREKLQLDIDSKREKINLTKKGLNKKAKDTIRQQGSLSEAIDDFINNKNYVNAMTGWRGRIPAVTDAGLEAEAFFDNIKNNLTLENLDKMTGVLSETDIKILSTSATAMQPGMSKKAMIKEMKKIQDVLKTKSKDIQRQLLEQPDKNTEASADAAQVNQDTEAITWAKANPNDPRAAQILQIQSTQ